MVSDAERHARAMLFDGQEPPSMEIAPHRTEAAQAWAMLAVANAIEELAASVENIRQDWRAEHGFTP